MFRHLVINLHSSVTEDGGVIAKMFHAVMINDMSEKGYSGLRKLAFLCI